MVKRREEFENSGQRAYLGLDRTRLVDTEPVLRDFGVTKKRAVEDYTRLVEARLAEKSQDDYHRGGFSGDEASRSGGSTRGRQFGIDETSEGA